MPAAPLSNELHAMQMLTPEMMPTLSQRWQRHLESHPGRRNAQLSHEILNTWLPQALDERTSSLVVDMIKSGSGGMMLAAHDQHTRYMGKIVELLKNRATDLSPIQWLEVVEGLWDNHMSARLALSCFRNALSGNKNIFNEQFAHIQASQNLVQVLASSVVLGISENKVSLPKLIAQHVLPQHATFIGSWVLEKKLLDWSYLQPSPLIKLCDEKFTLVSQAITRFISDVQITPPSCQPPTKDLEQISPNQHSTTLMDFANQKPFNYQFFSRHLLHPPALFVGAEACAVGRFEFLERFHSYCSDQQCQHINQLRQMWLSHSSLVKPSDLIMPMIQSRGERHLMQQSVSAPQTTRLRKM